MQGWGGLARAVGVGWFATIIGIQGFLCPLTAREPDGPIRFEPAWSEIDSGVREAALRRDGAELRLGVTPYVDIVDAVLVVRTPSGIGTRLAADGPEDPATRTVEPDGTTVFRIPLGDLGRSSSRALRFVFNLDRDPGAVVPIIVEGRTVDGRVVRDGCGVPVGLPGASPRTRHGAAEFRSVPARPEEIPGGSSGRGP